MFTLSSVSCTEPIAVPGSAGVGVGVTAGAAVGEPGCGVAGESPSFT